MQKIINTLVDVAVQTISDILSVDAGNANSNMLKDRKVLSGAAVLESEK